MSDVPLHVRFRLVGTRGRHLILTVRMVAGVTIAIFALATPGFVSSLSVNAPLNAISFIGCVAIGMTFITLTGNIMSLCLGATASASALTFLASLWLGVLPAFVLAIAFGVVITAAQGLLVGYLRANPILVSIAGLSLLWAELRSRPAASASILAAQAWKCSRAASSAFRSKRCIFSPWGRSDSSFCPGRGSAG